MDVWCVPSACVLFLSQIHQTTHRLQATPRVTWCHRDKHGNLTLFTQLQVCAEFPLVWLTEKATWLYDSDLILMFREDADALRLFTHIQILVSVRKHMKTWLYRTLWCLREHLEGANLGPGAHYITNHTQSYPEDTALAAGVLFLAPSTRAWDWTNNLCIARAVAPTPNSYGNAMVLFFFFTSS